MMKFFTNLCSNVRVLVNLLSLRKEQALPTHAIYENFRILIIPPFTENTDIPFSMLSKWSSLKSIWRLIGAPRNLHVKRFLEVVTKHRFTEKAFLGVFAGVRTSGIMHTLKRRLKISSEGSATPIAVFTKDGMSLRLKLIRHQPNKQSLSNKSTVVGSIPTKLFHYDNFD